MDGHEKLCVFCKHWYFSGGTSGYSELTPGSDAYMHCEKNHEIGDLKDMNVNDFRESIMTAETCPDYTPPTT